MPTNEPLTLADQFEQLGPPEPKAGAARMCKRRQREAQDLLSQLDGVKPQAVLKLVMDFAAAARDDEARILVRYMAAHPEQLLTGEEIWARKHYSDYALLR